MSKLTNAQLAELNNILQSRLTSAPAVNLVTPGSESAAANVKTIEQPSDFMRNFLARRRERAAERARVTARPKRGGKRRGKGRKTRRVTVLPVTVVT